MSTSRRFRISLALLASTLLMAHAPHRPRPPLALATVVYTVHLDHPGYRSSLGDPDCRHQCLTLTETIADSLGQLLRTRFGYVDWRRTGSTTDTVAFHWINDPERELVLGTALDFEVLSPARGIARRSFRLDFEDYRQINARNIRVGGWLPAAVSAEWMPRLSTALLNADLLKNIFTELPLDATVTFDTTGSALVIVPYAAIGRNVKGQAPTFRARATIDDTVRLTRASATIQIGQCVTLANERGYSCVASSIQYPGATIVNPEATRVVTRSKIFVESVHVNDLLPPSADSVARSTPTLPPGGANE